MEIPECCVQWLVINASSNLELACLSNVCKKWREIAGKSIMSIAKLSLGEDNSSRLLLLPSMVRYVLASEKKTNNEIESYCLAWFNPSGIRFKPISIDPQDDSEDEDGILSTSERRGPGSPQSFAPGGGHLYAGSEDESKRKPSRRQSNNRGLSSITARLQQSQKDDSRTNCLYQWDGLSTPEQILSPFGYSSKFVENLILEAILSSPGDADHEMVESDECVSDSIFGETRSVAVRGAIVARPEGYCMCWEHDDVRLLSSIDVNSASLQIRDKELSLLNSRRRRRRKQLQREVLPKVLNSAPPPKKGQLQHGISVPCVQFLNVDSSHAVRLFTPPFKPAPAPAPITVLCVGIATEDGCFMSGLTRRFEMGHLYPETTRDDMIERSPMCLCTDVGNDEASERDLVATDSNSRSKDDSYNSDDSSCDMSLEAGGGERSGFKCSCPFTGLGDGVDEMEEPIDDDAQICRGSLGPGSWHCYVGIFDGVASSIRIDGINETVRCTFPPTSTIPCLDGLTIGADHAFDMSLCFGQGSDGEGEGAIAELIVFKGKLDQQDIELLERRLMTKYGITASGLPEEERSIENHYNRIAHAMLSHPPGHKLFKTNTQQIPLRYMVKHRAVAWRQTNPVSGEAVQVNRIGTKPGESSSDF